MITRRLTLAGMAGLATPLVLPLAAPAVHAQGAWPNKPIRLIVAFAPGGQSDTIARLMVPLVSEALGQSIVVENRGGAGGAIAAGEVARSAPDGYTMLFDAASFLIVPLANKTLPFSYETDLVPVGQVAEQPYVLAAATSMPGVKDVPSFVAAVKAMPDGLNYGTPGVGSVGHLAGALLAMKAGIKLEHVPYRGGAEVARDMAGGSLQAGILSFNSMAPVVESGKARLIAVTSAERKGDKNLQAMAESYPGIDLTSWCGVFVRSGTPPEIIRRAQEAWGKVATDATVRERLAKIGSEPTRADAAAFAKRLVEERQVIKNVVEQTGIVFG
ncbi:tripartite tricarboxylate transporter substrate binding protein [Acetobacteraceae bacterium H6797]|nr:tripartite tricarboxylate transporter substrate binding protein [Acetobacteraceae bacterium H6797]